MDEGKILSLFDSTKEKNWVQEFLNFDIRNFEKLLRTKNEVFWKKKGEQQALRIFHKATQLVPAYKNFLQKYHINHERIKTAKDFLKVPITNKKNYIHAYSLKDRSWNGNVSQSDLIATSSGTTGEPVFWPRGSFQEFEAAITHELLYRYFFEIHKYKTLLIIGFPVGIYVSGVATLLPSWLVSQKNYNLTIVSASTNKQEILRAVRYLQEDYEQIVLIGHPFFIKDIVETGSAKKIDWARKKLHMMFCSEGFSEDWREYVLSKAGFSKKTNRIVNTYGSSELLLMAYETPFITKVKHTGKKYANLFQYIPLFRYIETVDNELIFTVASGVPLIRYNLHDSGQTFSLKKMQEASGVKNAEWQLPCLELKPRSDYTIKFHAVNIYPEHIRQALDYTPFLHKLTGRFVMEKAYTKKMEESLQINLELEDGIMSNQIFAQEIQDRVLSLLKKVNMEYLDMSTRVGKLAHPKIKLWPYQDEKYFKPGLKPKYILKNA